MLVLLAQNVYCGSFKDRLREGLKKVLEEQPESAEPTSDQEQVDDPTQKVSSSFVLELSFADRELMKQGMWRDPKTDLIWMRCSLGQVWSGTQCEGEPVNYTWLNAVLYVKDLNLLGHNDWRIPTKEEFVTIFNCDDGCSQFEESVFSREVFMTPNVQDYEYHTSSIKINYYKEREPLILLNATRYIGENMTRPGSIAGVVLEHRLILVRGGKPNELFNNVVEIAKTAIKQMQEDQKKSEERAEISKRENEEYAAKEVENRKLQLIRIQQAKQVYAAKTVELRKSVKVGDYTKQGLVIGINGALVKVQQYGRECIRYGSGFNRYTNSYDCVDWQKVITGDVWVKRNELLP